MVLLPQPHHYRASRVKPPTHLTIKKGRF